MSFLNNLSEKDPSCDTEMEIKLKNISFQPTY